MTTPTTEKATTKTTTQTPTTSQSEKSHSESPQNGAAALKTPAARQRRTSEEIQLLARIDRQLADVDADAARRIVAYFAQREFGGEWMLVPPQEKKQ